MIRPAALVDSMIDKVSHAIILRDTTVVHRRNAAVGTSLRRIAASYHPLLGRERCPALDNSSLMLLPWISDDAIAVCEERDFNCSLRASIANPAV